jgi:hypothetical protein
MSDEKGLSMVGQIGQAIGNTTLVKMNDINEPGKRLKTVVALGIELLQRSRGSFVHVLAFRDLLRSIIFFFDS